MKFEDRSREETERQQRCARSKACNLGKNIYKLKEKKKKAPGCVNKRAGGKMVCSGFRSEYAHGLQARLKLCWVGDHEDIKKSDDGDDGQREEAEVQTKRRCKPEKKPRYTAKNWTYSSKLRFSKKLSQFFPWGNFVRSWVYMPLDQRSKTTSHQQWQENWLQHIQLCTICGSWCIYECLLYNAHTYFCIIFITGFRLWCQPIHRKSSTRKKWKYEWRASGRPAAWIHRNRKQK